MDTDRRELDSFVREHGAAILRMARRHSRSAADADDAYQRALLALVTKSGDVPDDKLFAWALSVARNEAISEVRRGDRAVPLSLIEGDGDVVLEALDEPAAVAVGVERDSQLREVLQRLKPDQMRCLLLRADGADYPRICEITGFSYAKVNRCLSEGRQEMRRQFERFDDGADCRRLAGAMSMYADGCAPTASALDVELHLSNCLACRATLREYRGAASRVAAYAPVGIAITQADPGAITQGFAALRRLVDAAVGSVQNVFEQTASRASTWHQSSELTLGAKQATVAVAAAATLAGGALGVNEIRESEPDPKPDQQETVARDTGAMFDAIELPVGPTAGHSAVESAAKDEEPREPAKTAADGPAAGDQTDVESAAPEPAGASVPSDDFSPPAEPESSGGSGTSDAASDLAP